MGWGGIIAALVAGLAYATWFVIENWESLKTRFPLLEKIRLGITSCFSLITETLGNAMDWVGELFLKLKSFAKSGLLTLFGEGVKFNPFAEAQLNEQAKAPEQPAEKFEKLTKKPEEKEKKIKVVISGENMPRE